uniref:Uncharacterized protein n=1 Tax=Anguilla anguilla TaxID=7936 RepID=A0A0E9XIC8_ANGAN
MLLVAFDLFDFIRTYATNHTLRGNQINKLLIMQ